MTVRQCANGHRYDVDTYEKCPICGAPAIAALQTAQVNTEHQKKCKKGHIYDSKAHRKCPVCAGEKKSGKKSKEQTNMTNIPDYSQKISDHPNNSNFEPPAANACAPLYVNSNDRQPYHEPFFSAASDMAGAKPAAARKQLTRSIWEEPSIGAPTPTADNVQNTIQDASNANGQTPSIASEIRKASSNTSGKTMGYFQARSAEGAQSSVNTITEPTVGWLVCVSGAHIGQSFEIYTGNNTIGRNTDNRIVLAKDGGVSGNKHAVIIYEPVKRLFYLQPGDSSGLTYLNDEFLKQISDIKSGDIITVGNTKLMLKPLCGENFSWEKYISG